MWICSHRFSPTSKEIKGPSEKDTYRDFDRDVAWIGGRGTRIPDEPGEDRPGLKERGNKGCRRGCTQIGYDWANDGRRMNL